jgi:hypothetical protein
MNVTGLRTRHSYAPRRRGGGRLLGSLGGALAFALVCSGFASAAPVWRIDSLANTTVAPGGTLDYNLVITNVGDVPTDGGVTPITLTATLGPGLTFVSAASQGGSPNPDWSCSGTTVVTCTNTSDTFATPATDFGNDFSSPTITVAVDPGASGITTSSFTVDGGDPSDPSASTVDPTTVTNDAPQFGVDAFDGQVTSDTAGDPYTQAGGHPYAVSTSIDFDTTTNPNPLIGELWPVESTKDIVVDLPPGFIGNPTAATRCKASDLANATLIQPLPLCAPSSQVGTTVVRLNALGQHSVFGPLPVFNVVPPPDVPARFGFNILGTVVTFDGQVRSGGDYGLTVNVKNVSEGLAISGTSLTFWGVPSDSSHDVERACPGNPAPWESGPTCTTDAPRLAFLRNPTSCTDPGVGLPTSLSIDSWENPGVLNSEGAPDANDPRWQHASFISHNPPGYPAAPDDRGSQQGPTNCENVPFDPTVDAKPGTPAQAGQPSSFSFELKLPQSQDPAGIGEADLKKAVVTLPAGVRVSPSSADGLQACSPAQIGLHTMADPACPSGAKVGSLTIATPLLDQPLTGSIYLATPHDNPFNSLISLYIVAKGPGVIIKLPGEIATDPQTGQVTATFDNNPQLPFSDLRLDFKGGQRAPLVLPEACGTYTTHAVLTSWSGATVPVDSDFTVGGVAPTGQCPSGSQFSPGFNAGTTNPVAGADSTFQLQLTRSDQDQELSGLTVDMPTGLLARVANADLCADAAANAGACGESSRVGSVTVGAGAGTNPFYISNGRAYITGPYKGAPYGLSIVVPAVAGPFDLGNVIVRTALFVDRHTAQLRAVTDPLPTILQGIPLDVRDVRVIVDKPHFIVNPTSCAEKHVLGAAVSTAGSVAHVSSRFQVGECASLSLAPKLTISVGAKGRTRNGRSTPLSTTLTQKPGQTGLRSVSVSLPGTLNALLPVINRACSEAQYESGHCSQARAGSAVAVTPLLRDPLRGSAYFVRNPARILPDLVVALRGQIAFDLIGKVSIPGGKRLATKFDAIPDAPITKFTLKLTSGKNGPLGVVSNLCTAKARAAAATVGIVGQNGKQLRYQQRLHINGCPKPR